MMKTNLIISSVANKYKDNEVTKELLEEIRQINQKHMRRLKTSMRQKYYEHIVAREFNGKH